jgi:abortive infection bacteriophage resistance protein
MRDKKGIAINGSTQKKKLRYMGYFHGYKGYRYCYSPSSLLPYTGFNELQAVYEFDMGLKAILYPQIMFLETTIKNYALENILKQSGSERFADIYTNFLMTIKLFLSVAENIKNRLQSE